MFKEQGVTHIIATPHFYPDSDSAEGFSERVHKAHNELCAEIVKRDLPQVFLGCELRYFSGMGKSRAIELFVIKGTKYLLVELPYGAPITSTVIQDIIDISERQGLMPILAHIERYNKVSGYKKLLKLISDGYAKAHINAGAVVSKETTRLCEKLIKGRYVSYLASDTHSPEHRPPLIGPALEVIGNRLGKAEVDRLVEKSKRLLEDIEAANE
jgi:protein-tyrosine phosphatase